jgi:isopenicillin N synthase-like dioxygenase
MIQKIDQHEQIRSSQQLDESSGTAFQEIPIIDLSPYFTKDKEQYALLLAEVRKAATEVGFFYIKNHQLPTTIFSLANDAMTEFFDLPVEEKMKVYLKTTTNHRGYLPFKGVASGKSIRKDFQEGYEIAAELSVTDPDYLAGSRFFGPNLWPEYPDSFRQHLYNYFEEVNKLSFILYEVFALSLDLNPSFFLDKVSKPLHRLRVISYPSVDSEEFIDRLGSNAHTDFELFTILWQDNIGGLQILNSHNEWINATPIEGTFIINIGDLLARWTNDRYQSTVHRVLNNISGKTRHSLALFCGPDADTVVECLTSCQSDDIPPKYKPVTAGEWSLLRINSVYGYDSSPG